MASNNWSNVWINSSFTESDANCTPIRSNKRNLSSNSSFSANITTTDRCLPNNEPICWFDKYAPKTRQQLAVSGKKIKELSDWLSTCFTQKNCGFNCSPFLLINGPTGCGKTTALRVLANEINVKIVDLKASHQFWETDPFGSVCNSGSILANNQLDKFKKFVWDENKYTNSFDCYEQRIDSRSSNSDVLEKRTKKLILIEEFPHVFLCKPQLLAEELRRLRNSFGSRCVPIVFIISELNNGNSLEFKLLPKNVQIELQMEVISFTSITNRSINNVLSNISENQLTKHSVQDIVECSAGDIRSALNLFHVKYMHTFTERNDVLNNGCKSKKQKKSLDVEFYTGSRDNALTLPHAIGKILYAKRSANHSMDCADTCCSHKVAKQFERIPLIENPDAIADRIMVSPDTSNIWLHENYLDFVDDISNAEQCIHWLSESDFLFTAQDVNNKLFCDDYNYSVATCGIMFNVSTNIIDRESHPKNTRIDKKNSRGFKSFNKPKIYEVNRCLNSTKNHTIQSLYTDIFKYRNVNILVTDILPFVSQMRIHLNSLDTSMKSLLDSIVNYNDLHSNKMKQNYHKMPISLFANNFRQMIDLNDKHYHSKVDTLSTSNNDSETEDNYEIDCNSD